MSRCTPGRAVAGITAKMLSKELKELEQNNLLSRHVQADAVPVAVTYARPTASTCFR